MGWEDDSPQVGSKVSVIGTQELLDIPIWSQKADALGSKRLSK